jgi:PEP-CTERM motif
MKSALRVLTAAASLYALAPDARAALVTVDFDGLKGPWAGTNEAPANFYNGGSGSLGSGPGPDYGVTFVPFGITSSEPSVTCNDSSDCGGKGNSLRVLGNVLNGMEYGAIMQIEAGFRGIVEFDASISNAGGAYVVARSDFGNPPIASVYVKHPDPLDPCVRLECEFVHYSLNLADDPSTADDVVAYYLLFLTGGTDTIYIDNIRFHDLILPETPPTTVPEPSTALMIGSMGLVGAMLRRRQAGQKPRARNGHR